MRYAEAQELLDYLGGQARVRLNEPDSNLVNQANLESILEEEASAIRAANRWLRYPLATTKTPLTNRWLIQNLLNLEFTVASMFRAKSPEIDIGLFRFANTQKAFAALRINQFQNGSYFKAYKLTLPVDSLIDASDATKNLESFAVLDETSQPPKSFIEKLGQRESAVFRAMIAKHNLPQAPTPGSDLDHLYRKVIAKPVRAYVLRYNSQADLGAALDDQVNSLISEAIKDFTNVDRGRMRML